MPEVQSPPPAAAPKASPATPAPAAKPAPAAPSPKATPPPAHKLEVGSKDDVFAEADAAFRKQGMTPVSERDKPPVKEGDKPTEPAADKPPEKAPAPALAEKVKPTIKEPKELRQEYERLKGDVAAKDTAIKEMEARIAAAEAKGKDVTVLSERLASMEKDWEKDKALIRALKQEASPEFKAKYDEPFNEAVGLAMAETKGLQRLDDNGDPVAVFSWENDMVPLWSLYNKSPGAAIAQARKQFGDGAELVIGHLRDLRKMDYNRSKALDREKENWKKAQDDEAANAISKREQMESIQAKAHEEIAASVPEYQDGPEDTEASQLRKKGYEIFDAKPQTFQQHVLKQAHIRHRVAAFGVDQLKIQRLTKELNDAKAELEGFRNPQPGKDGKSAGGKATQATTDETWEDSFRKAMANA